MLDRRRFLLGAGGLLTAGFVRKATAYSRTAGEPLVLPSARRPEETLYVYSQDWIEPRYGKWRVSLGPNQPFAPLLPPGGSTCSAMDVVSTRPTISIGPASKKASPQRT